MTTNVSFYSLSYSLRISVIKTLWWFSIRCIMSTAFNYWSVSCLFVFRLASWCNSALSALPASSCKKSSSSRSEVCSV